MRRSWVFRIWLAGAFALLAGTTGGISGSVKDSAGAAIAGTEVVVTNTSMGTKTKSTSDKKGNYGFLVLPAGRYDLHAEAKGFKPQDHPGIVVHVNSAIRMDLTLEPEEK